MLQADNEEHIEMIKLSLQIISASMILISAVTVGMVLIWAEDILVPFVIAVFFTYLLRPLVDILSRPCCTSSRCGKKKSGPKVDYAQVGEEEKAPDVEAADVVLTVTKQAWWRVSQMPRGLAVFLSLVFVLGLFVGLGVLVMDAIQSFEENHLEDYEHNLIQLMNDLLVFLKKHFGVDGSYMLKQVGT